MTGQIELRDIVFENIDSVLDLAPYQSQQHFVGPVAKTIAAAYAGINEGYPGFLKVIYCDEVPVGIILIGRGPVAEEEPEVLQKYEHVYRIWDFFIDRHYQRQGIGRVALQLALEKLRDYPDAEELPMYLECHKENRAALALYESFGFQNLNIMFSEDKWVLIRFPDR